MNLPAKGAGNWAAIIRALQSPLAFFGLVLLVSAALLALVTTWSESSLKQGVTIALLVLIFLACAGVMYMAIRMPDVLLGRAPRIQKLTSTAPQKNDHVLIRRPATKEVIEPSGLIVWNKDMDRYIGSMAIVQKVDEEVRAVRLDIDGQRNAWSFDWLERKTG